MTTNIFTFTQIIIRIIAARKPINTGVYSPVLLAVAVEIIPNWIYPNKRLTSRSINAFIDRKTSKTRSLLPSSLASEYIGDVYRSEQKE
jgi:hypothetical protein